MNELNVKCKWVLTILLFCGCAHRNELSLQTMAAVETQVNGKSFWLKQSLYAGPFYDDNRFYMVHPSPFEELTYVTMPDGEPVLPPKSEMIIPAGTRVNILDVEWPDTATYYNRPLFSPRSLPWMKMRVALDRGKVSFMRDETFIFILPLEKGSEKNFNRWFTSIFSEEDSNRWLLSLKAEVRSAVLGKFAVVGMSHDALLGALGEPNSLSKEEVEQDGRQVTKEVAIYPKQIIVLINGVVSKIQVLTPSTPAQFQRVNGNRNG